ncbi:hypothetical protein PMAYCL1PPCAC_06187, partial [Pristionchus mayeri]
LNGMEVKAHKSLLIERSPYFAVLLGSNFVESGSDKIDLSRCDFESSTISSIIDYTYTGEIDINRTTAHQLMQAASFFQIESIVDAAASFLLKSVPLGDVLPLLQFFQSLAYRRDTQLWRTIS